MVSLGEGVGVLGCDDCLGRCEKPGVARVMGWLYIVDAVRYGWILL